MERYAVIMAGGSGRRLWPLSRASKPKQFLDITGNGTLISNTIKRLEGMFDIGHIVIIGLAEQREDLHKYTNGLVLPENIILEPSAKNTAACIALAIRHIQERSPNNLICMLPADHYIGNPVRFREVLWQGFDAAGTHSSIITLGIKPTFPATGYGYICMGKPLPQAPWVRHVDRFVEKPDEDRAREFLAQGRYLWNGGIFIFQADVMESAIRHFLPLTCNAVAQAYLAMKENKNDESKKAYDEIESVPIDTGVLEKASNVLVIPGDFGWNDVGSFDAIYDIAAKDEQGNAVLQGNLLARNAHNLLIHARQKLVVVSGVDDLFVIDTPDALYICNPKNTESVKEISAVLSEERYGGLE